jgi:hypothetical protein
MQVWMIPRPTVTAIPPSSFLTVSDMIEILSSRDLTEKKGWDFSKKTFLQTPLSDFPR